MIGSIPTAVSGLFAANRTVEASASNTANLRTTGPLPGAGESGGGGYQPVRATQASAPGGGVVSGFRPVTPAFVPQYEPSASFADDKGMVAAPNVDLVGETVARVTGMAAYEMNLRVFTTSDEMTKTLLDIGA